MFRDLGHTLLAVEMVLWPDSQGIRPGAIIALKVDSILYMNQCQ